MKIFLAAFAMVAASVMSQAAQANLDVDVDINIGRDGRYGRWICTTSSRGYQFRAEAATQYQASRHVRNLCLRHPYGTVSECNYNERCVQVNGGGGYPYPPSGARYTCRTYNGHKWIQSVGYTVREARERVLRKCHVHGSNPRYCESHLSCFY